MKFLVLSVGENNKVFDPIIKPIAVNMVDVLPRGKSTLKMLLHNPAMLSYPSTIWGVYIFIGRVWFADLLETKLGHIWGKMCFSQARTATILSNLGSVLRYIVRVAAGKTRFSNPSSWPIRDLLGSSRIYHLTMYATVRVRRSPGLELRFTNDAAFHTAIVT